MVNSAKAEGKTIAFTKDTETFRAKSKSFAKTQRALAKAPAARRKAAKRLEQKEQRQAQKRRKQATADLKTARKKFRKGKITEPEFTRLQKDLGSDVSETTSKISSNEFLHIETQLKRFLKHHKIKREVFDSFVLNTLFLLIEIIGGALAGSVTILAAATNDFGDVFSILFAFLIKRKNDSGREFTFGYSRHLVMATLLTVILILVGASLLIVAATLNLIYGSSVAAEGLIFLGIFGLLVNGLALFRPRKQGRLRRRTEELSVFKRSLELDVFDDCVSWLVVLILGVAIALTGWHELDAVCGIIIAVYLLLRNSDGFRRLLDIFLEKAPDSPSVALARTLALEAPHVVRVDKIHIWHLDLERVCATMRIEVDDLKSAPEAVTAVRRKLAGIKIDEATIEVGATPKKVADTTQDKTVNAVPSKTTGGKRK